ncbi:MAG: N-acetylneuraminate synthase family protein [Oligoflexales bacterium]
MVNIIAEFCQNHNGDYSILKEMIYAAAEAGATHGKIQSIFASDLTKRDRFETGLVEKGITKVIKRPYRSEYERLKKLELDYEHHSKFISDCNKANLKPLTTCFTQSSIDYLSKFDWEAIKVASYDCSSYPMLERLSKIFPKVVVSTGATFDEEIEGAAKILNESGSKWCFLHCVTIYPTPLDHLNLKRMEYLKKYSPEVGLSDHSLVSKDGVKGCLAAIFLGAQWLERHFTILPESETKDGIVSIRPEHITEILTFSKYNKAEKEAYIKEHIPEFEQMIGNETRSLTPAELLNRDYYRGRFAAHVGDKVVYNWESMNT